MLRRRLGSDGPEISVVGYGAWGAGGDMWGPEVDEDRVIEAMEAAVDAGVDWIDTAEAYGDGRSEELVGRVLRRHGGRVRVFTKVAPFASGLRAPQVHQAARDSLSRLGVEHIDLFQIHWPDEEQVRVEEPWSAMAELQDQGLVRWIGVSNFDRDLVERCEAIRHVDSVQNEYSLLHRGDDNDLLPWLAERGIGYLAYGPLAYGLLTGAISRDTEFDESDWRSGSWDLGYYRRLFAPDRLPGHLDTVDRLREIAVDAGAPLATLSLRVALATRGVTAVIAGSRNPKHAAGNARAGDEPIAPEILERVLAVLDEADAALSRR